MPTLRFSEANGGKATGFGCVSCGGALRGASNTCGACNRKRMMKVGIGVFIAAEVAMAGLFIAAQPHPQLSAGQRALTQQSVGQQSVNQQAASDPVGTQQAVLRGPQAPLHQGAGWLYYNTHDAALGEVTRHAQIESENPAPPVLATRASGMVRGVLELVSSLHSGRAVSVSFPRVKPSCGAKTCEVRAIFDETQPMVFAYTDVTPAAAPGGSSGTAAGTSTVLMLHDYDRFAQRLAVSHDLTLIASLGTKHDPVMAFNVSGYQKIETASRAHGRGVIQLAAR